jgi:hypothetical protein
MKNKIILEWLPPPLVSKSRPVQKSYKTCSRARGLGLWEPLVPEDWDFESPWLQRTGILGAPAGSRGMGLWDPPGSKGLGLQEPLVPKDWGFGSPWFQRTVTSGQKRNTASEGSKGLNPKV